jgi:subtilase family serine protease
MALIVGLVAPVAAAPSALGAAGAPGPPANPLAATVETVLGYLACGPVPLGQARCGAQVVTNRHALAVEPHAATGPAASSAASARPVGYGPGDLQSAYAVAPASGASGRTVAVIEAFDDPVIEADLARYRSTFGLPPCTSANGCFTKVNQNGGTNSPAGNVAWGTEHSLDTEMVSALCPNCRILLVEANSDQLSDLGAAVNTAARLGAKAISNSYGGDETASELAADARYYRHDGVAVVVSSGDSGAGAVQYPAASPYVTAVGGTTLTPGGPRGWTETAWAASGSGCSVYEAKPVWQRDTGCSRRTVADVAAVADPNTGVAVYDSYGASPGIPLLCSLLGLFCPSGGWLVMGGTSVASPIIAALYGRAGHDAAGASSLYRHPGSLNDITAGSNGGCGGYLCDAGPGYDAPTGLGTPMGIGAF